MELSFKERKKILKNSNTLDLTPFKLFSEEVDKEKQVTVIVPKFKNEFAKKLIVPRIKSADFRIKLEKFGSAVWMNLDGKKNVQEIIKIVSEKFGEELIQPEERVSKFIFQLYEQKLISFNEINR
ncbi:MAG: PqqD family protein [bacterium]|nr:PqqD family protein [bacterium]